MRWNVMILAAGWLAFALLVGCQQAPIDREEPEAVAPAEAQPASETVLCGKCGFVKGSDEFCKMEGKEKCPKCGLIKGSPGCCKPR